MKETMMMVNQNKIKKLIESGVARVIEPKYCTDFDRYLCDNFPWLDITGYSIDWNKVTIPYIRFRWDRANEKETIDFLQKTTLSKFEEVCFIYGANEPGLIVKFKDACKYFDQLAIFGVNTHFVTGVGRDVYNLPKLAVKNFIEIVPIDWLTALD